MMAAGAKHFFKDGKEYKGPTHKDAKGGLMSGATHTAASKPLVHQQKTKPMAKKGK